MVPLRIFAAVIFLISHSVSAATPFPEPVIFFNLTREEFMAKRSEHKLAKRDYVYDEIRNFHAKNFQGQQVIEARSAECAQTLKGNKVPNPLSRAFKGYCYHEPHREFYKVRCNVPPRRVSDGTTYASRTCWKDQRCALVEAYNYAGGWATFPYCEDILKIDKPPSPEVETSPRYEGWINIPPKPNADWPMDDRLPSPGTLDSHYEMESQYYGRTASWEYRGQWSNGWAFLVSSLVMTSSFSCLGCPSGTLYAETVGFKGKAVGFTLPHII